MVGLKSAVVTIEVEYSSEHIYGRPEVSQYDH